MANNNRRKRKRIIVLGGILLLILVSIIVALLSGGRERVVTVQVEKVQRRDITQIVTGTGKIQPEVEVKISAEVSGEIIEMPVKVGQRVKKGQLLVKIKPDFYIARKEAMEANLKSAMAQLEIAKANLSKAESEFKRAEELYSKKLISDAEYENARTNYNIAKAQYASANSAVEQARASLKQAQEDLAKTVIYSPIDGVVTQLNAEVGERVVGTSQMAGTVIMVVADLSKMEARVDVSEVDVVHVSIGDTAILSVDAFPERKIKGVVYEISNAAKTRGLGTQEEVVNFEVKIRILDKDIQLRPGMSVTADIITEKRYNVIAVPIQAVTVRTVKKNKLVVNPSSDSQDEKKNMKDDMVEVVFVVENGVAKMVPVKRGISGEIYVEIVEGLKGDEEIVVGSFRAINRELEDGVKVRVLKEKTKTKS
ncbi:efflux RND transporter periplasmic adaptor subunit [Candidatus Chrysopegis kryptomonas]|uniref:HlyD family secretion protein n=1 Tax=Candidatus Chryseopegocella kryptomonas TaxID=1633643 RepID=A0A0P1NYA7_9BACT|nr:efflux RND transporter periplasmic adaptor subunit [Candidatus Chrysopegis kryptomonas]CUT04041.1 HlyD family secretion protein [Candidatus Chrysopegis kryptomonas]